MNDRIYDNLRGRMDAHRETPPEGLWDDIERAMNRRAAFHARRRRISYTAGSVAAAVVAGALFFVSGGGDVLQDSPVEPLPTTISSEYHKSPEPEITSSEPAIAPVETTPARSRSAVVLRRDDVAVVTPSERAPEQPEHTPKDKSPGATETVPPRREQTKTQNPPQEEKPSSVNHLPPKDNFGSSYGGEHPRVRRGRWQAGLYAANVARELSSGLPMSDISSPSAPPVDYYGTVPVKNSVLQNLSTLASTPEPSYGDESHSLPVTVGVSVSYGIGERWSVASGASWTMLSSRAQSKGGTPGGSRKRTLHYIGIPLDVRYDLWSGGALSLYLSAGGQVEKSVSGTEIHTLSSGTGESLRRNRSISDRLQWSARGSAGLQWDFTRAAGIYLEPGVNYYFDNGGALETLYKAKPLNLGLRVGLRFSL